MRFRRGGVGILVLVMSLAVLTAAGCMGGNRNFLPGDSTGALPSGSAASARWAGKEAPNFALKDLSGNIVQLSDLRGKPVLINFWATWCPPCKEEMPDIERAYQKYKDQGWVFLGLDMKEDAATVSKFVKDGKYSWTFLLDSEGHAATSYLVTGVPETYLVDSKGFVQDFKIGGMTYQEFDSKLAKIK